METNRDGGEGHSFTRTRLINSTMSESLLDAASARSKRSRNSVQSGVVVWVRMEKEAEFC